MDGGDLREIVATAAQECFGQTFADDQDRAVKQLLRGMTKTGGCASRESFEQLVRTAFEAGIVAVLMTRPIKLPLELYDHPAQHTGSTITDCASAVERAEKASGAL
jgi:hypothetical protein